ncbi:MAG: PQQ-dependent sugar dehydrogenase [Halobacteriales archaeon]|nr:PQQ-dependent sugar dehydrogenase [Halobacteriales archaeon]
MVSLTRRRVLAALGAGTASAVTGCVGGDGDDTGTTTEPLGTVGLETVADGLESPIDLVFVPEEEVGYVAERPGRILVYDTEADSLREEPLLDISDSVVLGGERGLLGIEPHPNFAENGRLFVRYSAASRQETPDNYSHTFVLSEFEANDDLTQADTDSERTVLEIPQPQGNHNAGDIAFGPDGYLYVPVGDGGSGGDTGRGHVEDWYDANEGGNGQNVTENLLGSMLRIDVDDTDDGRNYAVPDDNPLVGREGLDEYYAWGLRNPWRISFDDGDLYVADVGQNRYEEINIVEKGGNYGWNVREGVHCYNASDCPTSTPDEVRGGEPLVDPILEYPHSGGDITGVSVIGGYVYRGSEVPLLEGRYVFGDLQPQGRLFVGVPPEDEEGENEDRWSLEYVELTEDASNRLGRILSFGRDGDGEMYVLGGGSVYRVVPS